MTSRWTSKLVGKAAKLGRKEDAEGQPQNVDDFLGGFGKSSQRVPVPQQQQQQHQRTENEVVIDNDEGGILPPPIPNPQYVLRPMRKGRELKVGFTEAPPAIIGEGGDEAELPTSEVRRSASRASQSGSVKQPGVPQVLLPVESSPQGNRTAEKPGPIVGRSPTRKPELGHFLQKRNSMNFEEGSAASKRLSSLDFGQAPDLQHRPGQHTLGVPGSGQPSFPPQHLDAAAGRDLLANVTQTHARKASPSYSTPQVGHTPPVPSSSLMDRLRARKELPTAHEPSRSAVLPQLAKKDEEPDNDNADLHSSHSHLAVENRQQWQPPHGESASPDRLVYQNAPGSTVPSSVSPPEDALAQGPLPLRSLGSHHISREPVGQPPSNVRTDARSEHDPDELNVSAMSPMEGPWNGSQASLADSLNSRGSLSQPRMQATLTQRDARPPPPSQYPPPLSGPPQRQSLPGWPPHIQTSHRQNEPPPQPPMRPPGYPLPPMQNFKGQYQQMQKPIQSPPFQPPHLQSPSYQAYQSPTQQQNPPRLQYPSPQSPGIQSPASQTSQSSSVYGRNLQILRDERPLDRSRNPSPDSDRPSSQDAKSSIPRDPRPSQFRQGSNFEVEAAAAAQFDDSEFKNRMESLQGAFAAARHDIEEIQERSLMHWLRVSSWWYLKGRKAFETRIREQSSGGGPQDVKGLKQPFVDVAKARYLADEVIPDYFDGTNNRRSSRLEFELTMQDLQQAHENLRGHLRVLVMTVTKRDLLPPPDFNNTDTSLCIEYPGLPAGVHTLTGNLDPRTLVKRVSPTGGGFFGIVLSDNDRHFSYGHLFSGGEIVAKDTDDEEPILPCIISIIRPATSWQVEMTILSQDAQIDLHVQSDRRQGLTWKSVDWRVKESTLVVHLSADFGLSLHLPKQDFKTLWGIHDYNTRMLMEWEHEKDEKVVFECTLHNLQYLPAAGTASPFPTGSCRKSKLRLFERNATIAEAGTATLVNDGHRLVIMAPPTAKSMSNLNHIFTRTAPILHNKLRDEEQAPALLFSVIKSGQTAQVIPAFANERDRDFFVDMLGASLSATQYGTPHKFPIRRLSVSTGAIKGDSEHLFDVQGLKWKDLDVVLEKDEGQKEKAPNRIRICTSTTLGSIVDLATLGPGELRIALDASDLASLRVWRPTHATFKVALHESALPEDFSKSLDENLWAITNAPSSRCYQFDSLKVMHSFEHLLTGSEVKFDGVSTSFLITRHRSVVGLHKKVEATAARIQVLNNGHTVQLVVFFEDLAGGYCMSVVLWGTDVYEAAYDKSKHYVRFSDAKFSLPRTKDERDSEFVCLDTQEFAGEHGDIMIGFESEEERDEFGRALPAEMKKASRLAQYKRIVDMGRSASSASSKTSSLGRPSSRQ